jgi:hypothetical protein
MKNKTTKDIVAYDFGKLSKDRFLVIYPWDQCYGFFASVSESGHSQSVLNFGAKKVRFSALPVGLKRTVRKDLIDYNEDSA